jgi:hypothetical protein
LSRLSLTNLQTPRRLPPFSAKALIALAAFILGIALLGIVVYDGVQLLAYEVTFIAIAMGNLAWGLGSLIPDERGGSTLRRASNIFSIIMFISLPITLAYQFIIN